MIFEYYLSSINTYDYSYKYIVLYNNDVFEYDIDLINNFPNYIFVENNYRDTNWYYNVTSSDSKIKGDIDLFDINIYNKNSYPKLIIKHRTEYKIANQVHYDKFNYILNKKNDNSKLYETIYTMLIIHYKQKYIKENIPIIKETIV